MNGQQPSFGREKNWAAIWAGVCGVLLLIIFLVYFSPAFLNYSSEPLLIQVFAIAVLVSGAYLLWYAWKNWNV